MTALGDFLRSGTFAVVLVLFVVIVYLAVAIFAFRLAGRWFPLGLWRPIVRGSVVAFFFGIGGWSAMAPPVPVLLIVVPTVIKCYDDARFCDAGILKLAFIQWLLWVALFLLWYGIPKAWYAIRKAQERARREALSRQWLND
jgi:hypothetical protein